MALDRPFTYKVPAEIAEKLRVGQLLRVPFSGRVARGFALAVTDAPPALPAAKGSDSASCDLPGFDAPPAPMDDRFKPVFAIEDEVPFFSPAMMRLVRWIADYTASPIETCLRAAVPAAVLKPSAKPKELLFVEPVKGAHEPLTSRQERLYEDLVRVGGGWMRQVVEELKTTPGTLRALAERGAVTIEPRVSRRDPLAGRRVMPTKPLALNAMQSAALKTILEPFESPQGRVPACRST